MIVQCNSCVENGLSSIWFKDVAGLSKHLFLSHVIETLNITCGTNQCTKEYSTDQKWNFSKHLTRVHSIKFKDWKPPETLYTVSSHLDLNISNAVLHNSCKIPNKSILSNFGMSDSEMSMEMNMEVSSNAIECDGNLYEQQIPQRNGIVQGSNETNEQVNNLENYPDHLGLLNIEEPPVDHEDDDKQCYRDVINESSGVRKTNMACSLTRLKADFNMSESCLSGIMKWTDILLARAHSTFVGGLKSTLSKEMFDQIENVTQVASGVSYVFNGLETENKRKKYLKNLVVSFHSNREL